MLMVGEFSAAPKAIVSGEDVQNKEAQEEDDDWADLGEWTEEWDNGLIDEGTNGDEEVHVPGRPVVDTEQEQVGTRNTEADILSVTEAEGLNYVGGYLCFKLGRQYPWIGDTATSDTASPYIKILSRGGLKMPSPRFKHYLNIFEDRFKTLHGDDVYRYYDPIGTLTALLEVEFPDIPREILYLFSKTRFFIRIKKLNNDLKIHKTKFKKRYCNFVNKM